MKKSLIVLSLVCLLAACNNETPDTKSSRTAKRDTTQTTTVHLNYGLQSITNGVSYRVEIDTFKWVGKDSLTFKKEWGTDTIYYVPVDILVDSAVAKAFNVPVLDSNGKKYVIQRYVAADPKYVREGVVDFQAAVKELSVYLPKKDSIQK